MTPESGSFIMDIAVELMRILRPLSVALILFCPLVAAQNKLEEKASKLIDYSYAGYQFGEKSWEAPRAAKKFKVEDYGAVANDSLDDSQAFKKALEAAHAHAGPVIIQLGAGRYIISEILPINRSDFLVQGLGMGEGGSELYFPRPLRLVNTGTRFDEISKYLLSENKLQVEPQNNLNWPFSPYSWTGGFIWIGRDQSRPFAYLSEFDASAPRSFAVQQGKRGERTIKLDSKVKNDLRVGAAIELQWRNTQGENGALVDEIYGTKRDQLVTPVGSRLWEDPKRILVRQISEIQKIQGNTVWLRDPLLHPINAALPAQLAPWEGLRNVTLKDFAMRFPEGSSVAHHLEEGYNAIYLADTLHAWIDSIRIIDADSGVLTYNSAASTIHRVMTEGKRKAHYSVHLGNVHGLLVSELQVRNPVVHPISFNTFCTRSVYQRAQLWNQGLIDQHAGVNHQNLVDQSTFYVHAIKNADGIPSYPLWDGSGAGYWQPGHGRFNTHWNLNVQVLSGAASDQTVILTGLDEGPDASIIGLQGNRAFEIRYFPAALVEFTNQRIAVPSLYDWQLAKRLGNNK
jgi:hypothetical protein